MSSRRALRRLRDDPQLRDRLGRGGEVGRRRAVVVGPVGRAGAGAASPIVSTARSELR